MASPRHLSRQCTGLENMRLIPGSSKILDSELMIYSLRKDSFLSDSLHSDSDLTERESASTLPTA